MEEYPRVIFGAGKQAGHILSLLEWMGLPWKDCLLFDDLYRDQKPGPRNLPIAGTLQDGIQHCCRNQIPAIVALGTRVAAVRYAIFQTAMREGVNLASLIHPNCALAPTATIGRNVVMMPGCVIGPRTAVGSVCCFFSNVTLEHDCQVGDNVVMGPGTTLSGSVQIGTHCFLGSGAVCAPGVRIEDRTLVGSGAVVVSDMPSGSVCFGVPARVRRNVRLGDNVPTEAQIKEFCRG